MDFPGAVSELSLERSRVRLRVLTMLSSLSEAYPRQLARACGLDCTRLRWIVLGHAPAYRESLALVPLGLARVEITPEGRLYVITAKGRCKARQLTARRARRLGRQPMAPVVLPGAPLPASFVLVPRV